MTDFDLLQEGQLITLEEDESMGIEKGLYRVKRVRYENDEVVYHIQRVHKPEIKYILTLTYMHGVGYWGHSK